MKKNKKILVVGRAGLDLYAHPINTPIENASQFTSQLGGSAANIAAGLAIQGNVFPPVGSRPPSSVRI